MESRLPRPFQEALHQSEAKSGVKLLTVALAGLIGTIGIAALVAVTWGAAIAAILGGLLLIATALTLLRALGGLQQPIDQVEFADRELVQTLVSLDRRAVALSDFRGEITASNSAFDRLAMGRVRMMGDLFRSDTVKEAFDKTLALAAQTGQSRGVFACDRADTEKLKLIGRRTGYHILWRASRVGDRERLDHERKMIGDWGAPLFERLGCGVLLEDASGKIHYINDTLREWMGLSPGEMPLKIQLKAGETQLLIGKKQRMDVDVVDMPLPSREEDRNLGRYRFLRKLDQMRGRLVPEDREFLIDPIFDAAPIAVAVVARDGGIKEYNQPLKRHPAGQGISVGSSVLDLVKEDDRAELKELIGFAHDGKPASTPLDVVYDGQPERVGQIYSSAISRGEETFAILYLIDTTQEKSLERQFVQAQKMQAVGQLAGGVAHDFNNLLTAIIGFCDLLLVRHDAGDQSFSDIIQIKQNANRAANLVRQLLAFSRQQTLRPKVLMMTDVLAELSNLIRRLIGENIELKVVHGRDLQPVKVDQGQLEQVIINLAVNARDAMPGGGKLEIKTSMIGPDDPLIERYDVVVPDDYVLVEVIDSGSGIAPENMSKIFEPFFTTKEVGQGTGLGLATVYGIVKQTGGFVFVESELGHGTRFLLFFKAHAAEAEVESAAQKPEAPARDLTGKGTILIVEDEDPVRMFACRALANKGYKVLEAASGEAGLDILNTHPEPIDLLISDVIMPTMDGPTLVKEARKNLPNLPVIFVSGYAEDVFRQNLEAEEFLFLPKPFSLKDLAGQVKSILG
ncbi:hybrid sensor histidine kinase/response regulator [Kordiimonas lacus]|uniref:histidine kinase n=1 Tax=Kordiimonas lacus TaxID=637679 RepID=A0A1G7CN36_9PROT|nr:ATP-binding protein [Kordiimonas lacus]SDE40742.1 two-component system, cell cycle sensor histidine kinase and response regulator CckA [Kordiimonas lacus]